MPTPASVRRLCGFPAPFQQAAILGGSELLLNGSRKLQVLAHPVLIFKPAQPLKTLVAAEEVEIYQEQGNRLPVGFSHLCVLVKYLNPAPLGRGFRQQSWGKEVLDRKTGLFSHATEKQADFFQS